MASPLLETKLFVPRPRRGIVARGRLRERLDRGVESPLTLVSAPAGFGKTTLVAEWLAARPDPETSAGRSRDSTDSQAASLWSYVIHALQRVTPGVGASALAQLEAPQPPPIETVLAQLINELAAAPRGTILVLDDYHVIEAPEVHAAMAFLLDHLPPQLRVVILTRADPPLPLARLRARGELTEIRAADLRFTTEEADAYLNGAMDLGLTGGDVAALEGRTEGWIAALQLAALSIQGRDDVTGFIAGFSGDDRYIVDYLAEEVLHRQPDDVRAFLLQSSILRLLSGPLCDAVTGHEGGRAMLEALERRNLFLVPLDDRRQWYRYHHLFADVLRARLLDEMPDQVAALHRRAGRWFEHAGDTSEAIRHAMAGGDLERAADLVELASPAMGRNRQEATVRAWLEALPDEVLRVRPVLANESAGSFLVRGVVDGVEPRLRDAERWLSVTDGGADLAAGRAAGMVVVDEVAFRQLAGSVAVHRAGQSLILGDAAGTVTHARRALELVAEDDHRSRGGAAGLLALAAWTAGDLEAAAGWYRDAMASLEQAGHVSDVIGCGLALADIRLVQGRLGEALRIFERGLALATGRGAFVLRGAADMHVGISGVRLERGDLEGARQALAAADDLGEENGLPQNPYRALAARAALRRAEGDLAGALELMAEAERRYVGDFSPDVRPVAAMKARLWVAQGRAGDALAWARDRGIAADDEPDYLHEFEHVTLARALLAAGGPRAGSRPTALDLLDRLLRSAEAGGRTASVIEILALQALGLRATGDHRAALGPLERALLLAEPEGYLRVFADEGPAMAALLEATAKRDSIRAYAHRLLAAAGGASVGRAARQPLLEPLSERELEVLRLLASDLDGPGIARELVVSLNTVRSHTKNIYAKLGVNSRREAVRRAAELDLLARSRR
jgi:LuxR family maltose regulon positive regulatory protein